ncbi:zinc transporter ZIP4-like, partial [Oxyura jamaicensis]|uniref:zinc transporter ZIP4-like n=1 Tax=Oxyura jamaicensis TaxID=8884 RepID=UPI0015A72382
MPSSDQPASIAEYLYGSLATLVICLASLVGAVVVLCSRCPRTHHYVLQLLLALAVGTLTGDALLHLLPQFLQLHSHAAGAHAHAAGAEGTWQLLAVLGGLYGFFLLEALLGILAPGGSDQPASIAEYLYGSLATLVICLASLVGAVVVLCSRCPRTHHYVLQLLLALAVGTLTGDALLHLLPQ